MMLPLGDLAVRSLRLLLLALVPYAAGLDARPLASRGDAGISVSGAAAVIATAIVVALVMRRRSRVAAIALPATVAATWIGAFLFHGDAGPLSRGVWIVAPFEWLALAAVAHAIFGASALRRWGAAAAVAVVAVASFGAAWPKLRSRQAMWSAALAQDPGNETVALAVAASLEHAGHTDEARATLQRCARKNPAACRCVMGAAEGALRVDRVQKAAHLLASHAARCEHAPGYPGLEADAWVQTGHVTRGLRLAQAVLTHHPHDPHAMFATAAAEYRAGKLSLAARDAERADGAGYGDNATMLVGLVDLENGDPARAAVSFGRVVEHDPGNAKAVYDLALTADRLRRYHDAREGYLAALHLVPTMVDARYNLTLLTFRAGAAAEARHDLAELERIAPNDARIPRLRKILGKP